MGEQNNGTLGERVARVEALTETQQKELDKHSGELTKHLDEIENIKRNNAIMDKVIDGMKQQTENIGAIVEAINIMKETTSSLVDWRKEAEKTTVSLIDWKKETEIRNKYSILHKINKKINDLSIKDWIAIICAIGGVATGVAATLGLL